MEDLCLLIRVTVGVPLEQRRREEVASVIRLDGVAIGVCVALLTDTSTRDPDVRQIRVRVVLGGKRLLSCAAVGQQLTLLAVPPLHASILKPNLHLLPESVSSMSNSPDLRKSCQ